MPSKLIMATDESGCYTAYIDAPEGPGDITLTLKYDDHGGLIGIHEAAVSAIAAILAHYNGQPLPPFRSTLPPEGAPAHQLGPGQMGYIQVSGLYIDPNGGACWLRREELVVPYPTDQREILVAVDKTALRSVYLDIDHGPKEDVVNLDDLPVTAFPRY